MKNKIGWVRWAALAVAGIWISACSGNNGLFNSATAEPTLVPVVKQESGVVAEGRVVPNRFMTLAFELPGKLGEIPAEEGSMVDENALLASMNETENAMAILRAAEVEKEAAQLALDTLNIDAELATSQAEKAVTDANTDLMEAQKVYNDTQTRTFRDDLDTKETAVQDRKETLDDEKTNLDKYTNLDEANATRISAQDRYDAALEEYNKAVYERDQLVNQTESAEKALAQADQTQKKAQRELDKMSAGANADLLAQAQMRLDSAQAQVDAAQRGLDNLELHAPFAGLVAEVKALEPGSYVSAGQPVVLMADNTTWYVETTDLTELDVVQIQEGDEVKISVDALPDVDMSGEVVRIAQTYTEKSGDVIYKVRIRCNNPPEELRWGMTVNVSFGGR